MDVELLDIPEPHVDEEDIPLLEPSEDDSEEMKSFFNQLLYEIKIYGVGYYMKQVENIMELPYRQFYGTSLGIEYKYNCFNKTCSFQNYVKKVSSKVGGFRPDINSDYVLHLEKTGEIGMIDALSCLFTRHQMIYYGW